MATEYISFLETPIGRLSIIGDESHITCVTFKEQEPMGRQENMLSKAAAEELHSYFAGELKDFTFPIRQHGTAFQLDVWERLCSVPYGSTSSYAAFSAHQPLAIRAIAAANGKNNIAIAVPCHRIIGSNGKLVGYAGGLWRKKWLLQHERETLGLGQAELKF